MDFGFSLAVKTPPPCSHGSWDLTPSNSSGQCASFPIHTPIFNTSVWLGYQSLSPPGCPLFCFNRPPLVGYPFQDPPDDSTMRSVVGSSISLACVFFPRFLSLQKTSIADPPCYVRTPPPPSPGLVFLVSPLVPVKPTPPLGPPSLDHCFFWTPPGYPEAVIVTSALASRFEHFLGAHCPPCQ